MKDYDELEVEFPWLMYVNGQATGIVDTLYEKEQHYRGSWQKRGGIGAFMMMCRKWDRIESICSAKGYDIFEALDRKDGDIQDDVKDLVGYLILILSENERRQTNKALNEPEHRENT